MEKERSEPTIDNNPPLWTRHGDEIVCPICGAPGRYDEIIDVEAEFENAIWINKSTGEWECWECWFK